MKQNGFINVLMVVFGVVLVVAIGYIIFLKLPTSSVSNSLPSPTNVPSATYLASPSPVAMELPCEPEKDGEENVPIIHQLSSYSGTAGTKLEIKGCYFSGFEGDKNAWIQNASGVKGLLRGSNDSTDNLIKVTLASSLCSHDTSYSGLPCDSFLKLVPGNYKIYVDPWAQKSNEVSFIVTGETTSVKVYFHNTKTQEANTCTEVTSITREIQATEKIATAAIAELLKGLSNEEKNNGFYTSIPIGSKLNSLVIVNGEARADFNAITESGGGSCDMAMRVAQIKATLLQFGTIKSVKLSIEGRTSDIFQP